MAYTISLDEVLELCAVAEQVRTEQLSPDNWLLAAYWDPDHIEPVIEAVKLRAQESKPKHRMQLQRFVSLLTVARALGQLQQKRLLALYPSA